MNEKPKKPLPKALKIILYVVLVVVILFAALFIWALVDIIKNSEETAPVASSEPVAQNAKAPATETPTLESIPTPTPEPPPSPTPKPTPSPTPTPTDATGLSISECAKLSESIMKKNYGDGYSIQIDGNMVTYNIWKDGVSDGALLAIGGSQEYHNLWDDMISGTSSLASSIQNYYDETCSESAVVVVNIVNDINKENILATFLSNLVVYDSVNNVNLLGLD